MQKKVEKESISALVKFQIDAIRLLNGFEPPVVRQAILSIIDKFDSMDCMIKKAQEGQQAISKTAKSVISGYFGQQKNEALNKIFTGGEFTDGQSFAPLSTMLSETFGEVLGLFIELFKTRGKDEDCTMNVESQKIPAAIPQNPVPVTIPGLPVSQIPPQYPQFYYSTPMVFPVNKPKVGSNPAKRSAQEMNELWQAAQEEYYAQDQNVQDVPRVQTPQEAPRYQTQEAPRYQTPKEIPRVQTPKEIPRVQTPKESPKGHGASKNSNYINPDYVPPQRSRKKKKGCKCTHGCNRDLCLCVRLGDWCNNTLDCDCIGCNNFKTKQDEVESNGSIEV